MVGVFALAITACSDDDDNLDDGLERAGYFQGTVNGTMRDGTLFEEPFRFEYAPGTEAIFQNVVRLTRTGKPTKDESALKMNLTFDNGVPVPTDVYGPPVEFQFLKKIASGTLFVMTATPFFEELPAYTTELSRTENENYHFGTDAPKFTITYHPSYYNSSGVEGESVDAYEFYAYYEENSYTVYYSQEDGSLLGIRNDSNVYLEEGAVFDHYNQLIFIKHTATDMRIFFNAAMEPLHEVIPAIPADELEITDFNHDEKTGIMSFGFELNCRAEANSTGHPLTIVGSFNSGREVYREIVNLTGKK